MDALGGGQLGGQVMAGVGDDGDAHERGTLPAAGAAAAAAGAAAARARA